MRCEREKLCAKPHPLARPKQVFNRHEESNGYRRTLRNPLIHPTWDACGLARPSSCAVDGDQRIPQGWGVPRA
jgi:hypothetical protein